MMKLICDIFCEKLHPRSGVIQKNISGNDGEISLDIRWKGDIHFIVSGWIHHGWYFVQRDNQPISPFYFFRKIEDKELSFMQHIIDEIESGKYKNKKTEKEKIKKIVEERKLTSFMNNTKWKELIELIMKENKDIPIKYKTIFDSEDTNMYWTIDGDEHFRHMNMGIVEWFKIGSEMKKVVATGYLIDPKVSITDKKQEIEDILHRLNIPYEYDDGEKCFTVFGYR